MQKDLEFIRIDEKLVGRACEVMALAERKDLSIVTAESCSGGLLAAVLSEAPGASEHLHGGFVTYTKTQKTAALGVPSELLARCGAVCGEVAAAMAEGALARSPADIAIAITGVAGPTPDEDGNPVGLMDLPLLGAVSPPFASSATSARSGAQKRNVGPSSRRSTS